MKLQRTPKLQRILASQVTVGDRIAEDDPSMALEDYEPQWMEWLRVTAVEHPHADQITIVAREDYFSEDSAMAGYPELIETTRFTGSPDQILIKEK